MVAAVFMIAIAALPSDHGMLHWPPTGGEHYTVDEIPYQLGLIFVAACSVAVVHRTRVELDDDQLTLTYVFRRKVLPVQSIVSVETSRQGLIIKTQDGRTCLSPMGVGQKAPMAKWLGRRTRADDIADAIMARAQPPVA